MKDGDWQLVNMYESHFRCPVCGSSHFGTDLGKDKGHCHGSRRCKFAWDRKDDAEYFFFTLRADELLKLLKAKGK